MNAKRHIRILEVVQSLEKGGRTKRFTDTVAGLRNEKHFVLPLCLSSPESWVTIDGLEVIHRGSGISWQLIFKIRKLIKQHNIDIIHAHCELSQLYAGIAGFLSGVKTVGTFHRSDLSKYQPNAVNKLIRFFVSQYVAVSHDRLSLLTNNLALAEEKCHVVHGGTEITGKPTPASITLQREKLNIPQNQIVLLSLGHLGEIKGHQDTIIAISKLQDKCPNIHLYIAGDGNKQEKQVLTDLVEHHNLQDKITFLGQINNAPQWLEACDIFVQPSIEEAFGLVFVEAGAKAKPVVATNVGGIKEIIVEGKTGFLVPPASPEQLADKLKNLLESTLLRQELGENAYKRIWGNFSINSMVTKYLKIFDEVI